MAQAASIQHSLSALSQRNDGESKEWRVKHAALKEARNQTALVSSHLMLISVSSKSYMKFSPQICENVPQRSNESKSYRAM